MQTSNTSDAHAQAKRGALATAAVDECAGVRANVREKELTRRTDGATSYPRRAVPSNGSLRGVAHERDPGQVSVSRLIARLLPPLA